MSEPRNHHYVPQWLLRAWCSPADNRLQSFFRLDDGRLSSQRRPVKSVASQVDLYSWIAPDHPNPTQLEAEFFQELDSKAARAAAILREPGTRAMTMEVRYEWARFLTASFIRSPLGLGGWKDEFRNDGLSTLGTANTKLVDNVLPGWFEDTAMKLTVEFLKSDSAVDFWIQMRWWVECTDEAAYRLLTSDAPGVGRTIGGTKHKILFYPLAPNRT